MSNVAEVKRGRGRPKSFPNVQTKMAGFNLPVETLELVSKTAEQREIPQNVIVERALRAYLRNRKG